MRLALATWIKLFSIALVSSTIGQSAAAQSSGRSLDSYRRFARAIQTKADSVTNTLAGMSDAALSKEGPEGGVAGSLRLAAKRANRLVGDFDAIAPPADFVRLKQQMLEPLQDFTARVDRMGSLLMASCAQMIYVGVRCNDAELKANSRREAYQLLAGIMEPIVAYLEVRERAQRMLNEHNVDLPNYQQQHGSSLGGSQDSYRRFAGAIQTKADSAARALNSMSVSGLSAEEAQTAMPGMLRLAANRANRLVRDFDAITPPTDFVRVEQQMVEPLRDFASRLDRVASLLSASCARLTSAGVPCNEAELKANSATEAYSQFASIREPIVTYMEVRERAQRMLKEHNVDLPNFDER